MTTPDEIQSRIAAGETPEQARDEAPLPCPNCGKTWITTDLRGGHDGIPFEPKMIFRVEHDNDCSCILRWLWLFDYDFAEYNALCRKLTKYAEIEQEFGGVEECVELARIELSRKTIQPQSCKTCQFMDEDRNCDFHVLDRREWEGRCREYIPEKESDSHGN